MRLLYVGRAVCLLFTAKVHNVVPHIKNMLGNTPGNPPLGLLYVGRTVTAKVHNSGFE